MARNYYHRNDDGCGCWIIIIITILLLIVSGIRGCINGDFKLPRSGSPHVSGGSGRYGTSNGANIQYPQTTSPNFNSSSRDYSDMPQNQPSSTSSSRSPSTKVRQSSRNSSSSNQYSTGSTSHDNNRIFPSLNNSEPTSRKEYSKCSSCNGKGYTEQTFVFDPNDGINAHFGSSCGYCNRTDLHSHKYKETCFVCQGTGKSN